ncbi:hypothetical protein B5F07_10505 [Lachnoclostridium sp. An169]|uniref:hypothetical protein n=1 Tax=Lachnoclostridium sp. An169 TaxID=1965569 RepID=UPI000B3832E4|nr:hypothetical protein [Lachnoclostridium sp. An169]OUP83401.1 hypothetical protein B5F07_10505 [Lachnoclostridium sp. An169]HJA67142.1 hypothetical protein [Candidatus Mediterraneibacter cottocaccae]
MLIRSMLFHGAKTDEEFREKLKARRRLMIPFIVLGLAAVIAGIIAGIVFEDSQQGSFLGGMYTGAGAAVTAAAIVAIIRINKTLKDEKRLHRQRIEESDERRNDIVTRSSSMAGFVMLYVCFAGLLIAGFFSMAVYWTLWCVMVGYFLCFVLLNLYFEKKL